MQSRLASGWLSHEGGPGPWRAPPLSTPPLAARISEIKIFHPSDSVTGCLTSRVNPLPPSRNHWEHFAAIQFARSLQPHNPSAHLGHTAHTPNSPTRSHSHFSHTTQAPTSATQPHYHSSHTTRTPNSPTRSHSHFSHKAHTPH